MPKKYWIPLVHMQILLSLIMNIFIAANILLNYLLFFISITPHRLFGNIDLFCSAIMCEFENLIVCSLKKVNVKIHFSLLLDV